MSFARFATPTLNHNKEIRLLLALLFLRPYFVDFSSLYFFFLIFYKYFIGFIFHFFGLNCKVRFITLIRKKLADMDKKANKKQVRRDKANIRERNRMHGLNKGSILALISSLVKLN